MPEPFTVMAVMCGLQVAATCSCAVIGYYAQKPSIVHNNTFVYNDTHVNNVTHNFHENHYHFLDGSSVSLAMLPGSSCVIQGLLHGIPRTGCPENGENPLAIAQFTELATGLNNSVAGVHVTIGSVANAVHALDVKSVQMMEVLQSVANTQSDNFAQILRLELEKQALRLELEKQALQHKAQERLTQESTSHQAEVERLTQESTSHQAEVKRLAEESKSHQAEVKRLAEESKSHQAEIQRLTTESKQKTEEIERLKKAQIPTDNKCEPQVTPVAAFKDSWSHYVVLIILLVANVFTHQSFDDSKNRLRQRLRQRLRLYFDMYKSCVVEKKKRRRKHYVEDLLKIATLRKEALEGLETFKKNVPHLNRQIIKTTSQLATFESRLNTHSIEGWTSYEIPLEGTDISPSKQVQDIVQYLQQACVSQKLLGSFGRKLLKATQYNAVITLQKWYRAHLQYLCLIKGVIKCQTMWRGITARKQMIAKKRQPEPSTEIETRPGTPVGKPGTPETPLKVCVSRVSKPSAATRHLMKTVVFLQAVFRVHNTRKQMKNIEKQPEQSPALVSPVSNPRAPTRAGARVSKPSVQVDEEHDWHVAVLTAFVAEFVVLVCCVM